MAIAIALLPVLLLSAAQSVASFRKETDERRSSLVAAAQRSVATARARLDGAKVVLQAAASPVALGVQCAPRLRELAGGIPGAINVVRLDRSGRVVCAADGVLGDSRRSQTDWFLRLRAGAPTVVEASPQQGYARAPALMVATRARDGVGGFDGAVAAFIAVSSLRPEMDGTVSPDTQAAMIDRDGRLLNQTEVQAFSRPPRDWVERARRLGTVVYHGQDQSGRPRVFTLASLPDDVFAVFSAPSPSPISWARRNLASSVVLPLIAFFATLAAVLVTVEQVIVRWLRHVERIAAIYAEGRFTARPARADKAPPEIRKLSQTLDAMAETIVARDVSLREARAEKDVLMREIYHRVRNNLQVISSILSLQQRSLPDPSARAALSDARERVSALALIYQALYQGPDLQKMEVRTFLQDLIAELIGSHLEAADTVHAEFQADDLILHPDNLATLGLFAAEAITNAQKHTFSHRGGTLRIRFRTEGKEAELQIACDGMGDIGPPVDGDVSHTLMAAFARQLRGQADFTQSARGGTMARLRFPVRGAPEPSHSPLAVLSPGGTTPRP